MVKKINSKAQVKIQQTAFMLLALTILFVMVFLFIVSFKSASLRGSAEHLAEQDAVLMASKLAESAEFSCETAYGSSKDYCIDFDKVFVLKKNIKNYENFWGVENIEIRKLYPQETETCTISNYPNCGYIKLFDKPATGADYSTFVNLCRKEYASGIFYNKCEIGILIVRYNLI